MSPLAGSRQNESQENVGRPVGKLYSLTPLSGKGAVRGTSRKWNAVGTGAYVGDLSK